ncbi:MAG: TIGR02301 family protein [Rhizobiaceae bacterium]|nr:TIGR02301 family protein [Rhizobiaceae bacterium]MCV0408069.1 TIGR02301 family protein [Rhizobiaceae bacterium]
MRIRIMILATILASAFISAPVRASEPLYESRLLRLAEILGSIHFLRTLCGEEGNSWRAEMEKLLETEAPDAERRARLVGRFNRGYRAFDGVYSVCTSSATAAIERYMKEGEELSREIATRFGN